MFLRSVRQNTTVIEVLGPRRCIISQTPASLSNTIACMGTKNHINHSTVWKLKERSPTRTTYFRKEWHYPISLPTASRADPHGVIACLRQKHSCATCAWHFLRQHLQREFAALLYLQYSSFIQHIYANIYSVSAMLVLL